MLPKISCYNDTCWFVHDMYLDQHIARVVMQDPELDELWGRDLYFRCVPADKYDAVKHHYWVFIPEWNMYRCNISAG